MGRGFESGPVLALRQQLSCPSWPCKGIFTCPHGVTALPGVDAATWDTFRARQMARGPRAIGPASVSSEFPPEVSVQSWWTGGGGMPRAASGLGMTQREGTSGGVLTCTRGLTRTRAILPVALRFSLRETCGSVVE